MNPDAATHRRVRIGGLAALHEGVLPLKIAPTAHANQAASEAFGETSGVGETHRGVSSGPTDLLPAP